VQLLPPTAQQGVISRVLHQRVLEGVLGGEMPKVLI
jgi:hypothetical protein